MRTVWRVYLLLLFLSIPWYLPSSVAQQVVWGFPLWACVALACYVVAAFFSLYAIEVAWREDED